MKLQLNQPAIENLRRYPAPLIDRLAALLQSGAEAEADAGRAGFYDVAEGSRVYYIHISPVSGRVLLLATWEDEPESRRARPPLSAALAMQSCCSPTV